jgi:cyclophilin family peptidyl-prolyl cis-trans isomerase
LKNVQKFCTNCTDKVKADAGLYADDQFLRVIDAKAIQEIKSDLYSN